MVVLDHRHLSKTLSKHYDITRATSSWITGNDERRDRYLSRALREAQGTGDVIVSVIVNENRENMRMFDKRVKGCRVVRTGPTSHQPVGFAFIKWSCNPPSTH